MGWTWEVEAYTWKVVKSQGGYHYVTMWTGESLIGAIRAMRAAKKTCGAVRLTWRG